MPYIDGKRVTMEQWMEQNSSIRKFHTGPRGENPAADPILDEETKAPTAEPEAVRSPRSAAAATAAIADAMGVSTSEVEEAGIDPAAGDPVAVADAAVQAAENAAKQAETGDAKEGATGVACDAEGCTTVAKTPFGLLAHKRAKHPAAA